MESESDAEYAARAEEFRRDQVAEEQAQYFEFRINREDRLWATSERVFIARMVNTNKDKVRARGSFKITVTLQPTQWLKGEGPNTRFKLKPIDYNSCNYPGNGAAIRGDIGELFLIFADPGRLGTRRVKYTLRLEDVVSDQSKSALGKPD
ncbi:hypothetical protein [Pontixanthobacter aquaemixtae]|uniref:Uncharacterized protein n=1 Tax=Pontixanthobacter aquaemixtae TaxID=1958940 RepID=A0A844ZPW1_9SPHN|nr:hypothetical protein [Pontixanthobacter aquaemixtae]MXO89783.1 hypothetical protein [Pontixanthobacter aquaemixtae]